MVKRGSITSTRDTQQARESHFICFILRARRRRCWEWVKTTFILASSHLDMERDLFAATSCHFNLSILVHTSFISI